MKKKSLTILAVAALLSVVAAGIGTASAYFTSYVEAKGQKVIHLGDTTKIQEEFDGKDKVIAITNDAKSPRAVWVRAKAFAAGSETDKNLLTYTGLPERGVWAEKTDGYWYYTEADSMPLEPGKTTDKLKVAIDFASLPKASDFPETEKTNGMNIIVIYETTPAVENGVKTDDSGHETILYLPPADSDWTRTVVVK